MSVTSPTSMPLCNAVEVRLDALSNEDNYEALTTRPCAKPILLTYRHSSEGGLRQIDEAARIATMRNMLSLASAFDWEIEHLDKAQDLLRQAKDATVPLIASAHYFEKTPSLMELKTKEAYARQMGASMVKFAFRLNSPEDMMVGVEMLRQATGPIALMGMGSLGPVSRLLYGQMGSALVYSFLGETPAAPGQWPAKLCAEVFNQLSTVR